MVFALGRAVRSAEEREKVRSANCIGERVLAYLRADRRIAEVAERVQESQPLGRGRRVFVALLVLIEQRLIAANRGQSDDETCERRMHGARILQVFRQRLLHERPRGFLIATLRKPGKQGWTEVGDCGRRILRRIEADARKCRRERTTHVRREARTRFRTVERQADRRDRVDDGAEDVRIGIIREPADGLEIRVAVNRTGAEQRTEIAEECETLIGWRFSGARAASAAIASSASFHRW